MRANDVLNNLNWSATETFTHNLPAPSSLHIPKAGTTIPLLSWPAVTGAVGYTVQVTTGNGSQQATVDTPYHMTPAEFMAPGISHLQIQSIFPGGLTSAFSKIATYNRTLPSPGGIRATKHGARILVSWKADPLAKAIRDPALDDDGLRRSDRQRHHSGTYRMGPAGQRRRTRSCAIYWRLAAVDYQGNIGAWHYGCVQRKARQGDAQGQEAQGQEAQGQEEAHELSFVGERLSRRRLTVLHTPRGYRLS